MPIPIAFKQSWVWWLSAAAGAGLGLLYRLLFAWKALNGTSGLVMTVAYLVIVPAVMGWLTVRQYLGSAPAETVRWYKWLFLPWGAMCIAILVAIVAHLEGLICVLFAAPIMLFFSLAGGLIARIIYGFRQTRTGTSLAVAALPLLLVLAEIHVPSPAQVRTVNTEMLIHAPIMIVWNNIEKVRAIDPRDLPNSWVNRVGFPRPVEATLSHEGIGGVRQASFTGGLLFTETVDTWQPGEDLRFSIRANTDAIPTTTLDEHVTIGGPYFDVLEGEYRLEPRPDGVLLHLTSHERLSTHLNGYAGLWTDGVMRAIQKQILEVIRTRCETEAASHAKLIP